MVSPPKSAGRSPVHDAVDADDADDADDGGAAAAARLRIASSGASSVWGLMRDEPAPWYLMREAISALMSEATMGCVANRRLGTGGWSRSCR